jgi:hypothetical protein
MITAPAISDGPVDRAALIRELQKIRQESVIATRKGDFRRVAQAKHNCVA